MDAQLLAAELGVATGLIGAYVHRRGRVRAWLPHLLMAAAMAAMAVPARDPLGPAGWMLLLGCAAAWAMGRPRPGRTGISGRRAALALDLYAMGVLTLLMPAVHAHNVGPHHHEATAATGWWQAPYIGLLCVWFTCRVALAAVEARRRAAPVGIPVEAANPTVTYACSAGMMAAMGLMAFGQ
ncbi:DUF5134 domain-containing protein [Yinghuangia seranimata]|uniref:DUF5134 domain-containing protein n=1 Tax=Yinghuangia seranimata TaxID=408067 RepID=UPI00248A9EFA|nr:DUF5134 domain-containing protein [Yinghuangia seranimata]MDI2132347.1 DUF5134 domain-containing protein [Yinghuangia seranimata]